MACPFAQFSPVVLLSLLALFFQFGASFFSPKPLVASLHRGRALTDAEATRTRSAPLARPHNRNGESGRKGHRTGAQPRMIASVLAPVVETVPEDLQSEAFPWTTSLGTGKPLRYAKLLRWQIASLQAGVGLDRTASPRGMNAVINSEKQARVRNLLYSGNRIRRCRVSYLDTPSMQVYSSATYSTGSYDFPILGVSAMAMGRVRVMALDLQPLFPDSKYAAKYAASSARLAAIRNKYPQLRQELQKDYYRGSPFFSDNMLYARWGPEEEASGFMDRVIMPAFKECVEVYIDLVNSAVDTPFAPGSSQEQEVLERQSEFDRFHAEREQVRPTMTANFGSAWTNEYISDFLFAFGNKR